MERLLLALLMFAAACGGDVGGVGDLAPGQCMNFDFESGPAPTQVEVVPCDEPHDHEVAASFSLPLTKEPFPGDQRMIEVASYGCIPEIEMYTGQTHPTTTYRPRIFRPSADTWPSGDRLVLCFVSEPGGGKLQVSVRADDVGDRIRFNDLAEGDCFDWYALESLTTVERKDCDDPHMGEVTLTLDLPADENGYPGDAVMDTLWEDECLPSFLEYTGRDYADAPELDTYVATPTEASWALEDRRVVCWLVDLELEPMVGSLGSPA